MGAHCLPGLSLTFLRRQAPYRAPLIPRPSVSHSGLLYRKKGIVNTANEPLGPTAIRLPRRLSYWAERTSTFHCPSLCSFLVQCFSDRRGCSFSCVRTRACGRYVWVFLLFVCVCLQWRKAAFFFLSFSNTEMWRPTRRTFFFLTALMGAL